MPPRSEQGRGGRGPAAPHLHARSDAADCDGHYPDEGEAPGRARGRRRAQRVRARDPPQHTRERIDVDDAGRIITSTSSPSIATAAAATTTTTTTSSTSSGVKFSHGGRTDGMI